MPAGRCPAPRRRGNRRGIRLNRDTRQPQTVARRLTRDWQASVLPAAHKVDSQTGAIFPLRSDFDDSVLPPGDCEFYVALHDRRTGGPLSACDLEPTSSATGASGVASVWTEP